MTVGRPDRRALAGHRRHAPEPRRSSRQHRATFDTIWPDGRAAVARIAPGRAARERDGGIWFVPRRARAGRPHRRAAASAAATPRPRVIDLVRAATTRALDVALPGTCVGCAREGPPLCRAARPRSTLDWTSRPVCPSACPPTSRRRSSRSSGARRSRASTRAALHGIKYGAEQRLAEPLGRGRRAALDAGRRRRRGRRPCPGPRRPAARSRLRPGRAHRPGRRPRAAAAPRRRRSDASARRSPSSTSTGATGHATSAARSAPSRTPRRPPRSGSMGPARRRRPDHGRHAGRLRHRTGARRRPRGLGHHRRPRAMSRGRARRSAYTRGQRRAGPGR